MSSKKMTPEKPAEEVVKPSPKRNFPWKAVVSWGATALLVGVLLLVLFRGSAFAKVNSPTATAGFTPTPLNITLPTPEAMNGSSQVAVPRQANLDTNVPDGIRQSVIHYTIQDGDSIFGLASQFKLQWQSIIWANYDYFGGDPTVTLTPGDDLIIPPTDGVLIKWKAGDDLAKIAGEYGADESQIISWPSNHLDVTDPVVTPDSLVMIPGGSTDIKSFIQAVEYTSHSGVTRVIAGPGGCQAPASGPVGSTAFIWPSGQHWVSGFDFLPYHKGIDIAAGVGDSVWASDNGTVVYAGWNDTGYGNLVEIDHNNGYITVYGHLSYISVTCGQYIYQDQTIGLAGATGNATGPHLHFEVRLNGGWVNPHYVLPPP